MLLIEILAIVYKKLYIFIIVFLVSFFLLSNTSFLKEQYIMKRYVVSGEHNGTKNFPAFDVFINSVNSPQFKKSIGIEDVWYELSKSGSGLLLTLKGPSSELIVNASKLWLAEVNQIEDDLYS